MTEDITLCRTTVDDAPVIVHHRRAMFTDMEHMDTSHASEFGRSLYVSMGFEPTNEMRLKL